MATTTPKETAAEKAKAKADSASAATDQELDALSPAPETLTLQSGVEVRLVDLKVRQFFRLMRILTRGAGTFLMQSNLSLNDSVDSFITKILSVLVVAFPEAEDESIDFLTSMIEPAGLHKVKRFSSGSAEEKANQALWEELLDNFTNPDLDDFVDVLEAVLQREAKDILRLGKRLQRMFEHLQNSGQLKVLMDSGSKRESSETSTGSTPTAE